MAHQILQPFGNRAPWAEPAWYTALESPYYNESHRTLRKYVRDYVDENIIPNAEKWEEEGGCAKEVGKLCCARQDLADSRTSIKDIIRFAQAGLALQDQSKGYRGGIPLPANIVDEEWDIFHFVVLNDELCRAGVGALSAVAGASAIGVPPIVRFGTEEQKSRWLPSLFTGQNLFCLGATEPTGGSDLGNLKTTAMKTTDGMHYVVNGHKKWISGALTATYMTTAVRTGGPGRDGISVLVIPTNTKGFKARKIKNSGVNAGASAWIDLENVVVPVENLIGIENQGFPVLMSNFNKERFLMAIGMNRRARTCLSVALEYAHDRHTFGRPLIANQIISSKFATMARYIESHWAWIEQIAYHIKIRGWTDELASRIALLKVHGGRILELANREAQQVLGGAGYQQGGVGGAVEQISRDLRMLVVGGGSEEIISDLALRQELGLAKKRGSNL